MIYNTFNDFGNPYLLNKYGEGTFGEVFTYENRYIYKKYKTVDSRGLIYDTLREIFAYNYFSKIKIPPCPKLHGIILGKIEYGIIIDKYTYTLQKLNNTILTKYYFNIAEQLLFHLCTLSLFGFAHRDIKPSNIILDIVNNEPILKLIDFGSTRYKRFYLDELELSNDICTLATRAPEILENRFKGFYGKYDPNLLDIWSVSATLYYILSPENYIFNKITEQSQYDIIKINLINPDSRYSVISNINNNIIIKSIKDKQRLQLLFDLLDKMLKFNPGNRIDINNIIEHPFMNNVRARLLDNIRNDMDTTIICTQAHLSDIRRIDFEWLITFVKQYELNFQLPLLLTILIIDNLINLKVIVNKIYYITAYIISAELLQPKSIDIKSVANRAHININDIIKTQIKIITYLPNLYEIIADSSIIECLDEYNELELIKIAIILKLYYPHKYYGNNNELNIRDYIINIYKGNINLSKADSLSDYNVRILN